jgi:hypothetical protein
MVAKAISPFGPSTEKPRYSENDKVIRQDSGSQGERQSVDMFRASEPQEDQNNYSGQPEDNSAKEQLLDQWYKQGGYENDTITEDVEAENAEDSQRHSKATESRFSVHQPEEQVDEPEEEENELHKIHMLQSLQALQYMKKVPLPHVDEIRDKMVFLPPPKNKNITKTLIFDMDETLIH